MLNPLVYAWDRINLKRVSYLGSPFLDLFFNHPWVEDYFRQYEILRRDTHVFHRAQAVDSVFRELHNAQNGAGHV